MEDALATTDDPIARGALSERWRRVQDEVASARADREAARDAVARAAGDPDAVAWVAAGSPVPPSEVLRAFERGAFEPLDAAVAREARVRRARSSRLPASTSGGDEDPGLRTLAEHTQALPAPAVPVVLRRLGSALGLDPDGNAGVGLHAHGDPGRTGAAVEPWAAGGPRVLLPRDFGGPGGMRDALGAFGRAVRMAVVRRQRGDGPALAADPAFDVAAEVLFRRLVLSEAFAAWAGMRARERWQADARFEESVAVRADGALLATALASGVLLEGLAASLERALGRVPSPGRETAAWRRDPGHADRLRGAVLGILVEERLLERHGTRWFVDRAAGRRLVEAWDAEPGETAESMAAAMSLGRIEPTPVLDRCRP